MRVIHTAHNVITMYVASKCYNTLDISRERVHVTHIGEFIGREYAALGFNQGIRLKATL